VRFGTGTSDLKVGSCWAPAGSEAGLRREPLTVFSVLLDEVRTERLFVLPSPADERPGPGFDELDVAGLDLAARVLAEREPDGMAKLGTS